MPGPALQRLDRQPPHRPRNADRADHLAAEIADSHGGAAHLAVELAVVKRNAGGANLVDFLAQPRRLGDRAGGERLELDAPEIALELIGTQRREDDLAERRAIGR